MLFSVQRQLGHAKNFNFFGVHGVVLHFLLTTLYPLGGIAAASPTIADRHCCCMGKGWRPIWMASTASGCEHCGSRPAGEDSRVYLYAMGTRCNFQTASAEPRFRHGPE